MRSNALFIPLHPTTALAARRSVDLGGGYVNVAEQPRGGHLPRKNRHQARQSAKFEVSVFTFHSLSRTLAQDDETWVQFIIGGVAGSDWD